MSELPPKRRVVGVVVKHTVRREALFGTCRCRLLVEVALHENGVVGRQPRNDGTQGGRTVVILFDGSVDAAVVIRSIEFVEQLVEYRGIVQDGRWLGHCLRRERDLFHLMYITVLADDVGMDYAQYLQNVGTVVRLSEEKIEIVARDSFGIHHLRREVHHHGSLCGQEHFVVLEAFPEYASREVSRPVWPAPSPYWWMMCRGGVLGPAAVVGIVGIDVLKHIRKVSHVDHACVHDDTLLRHRQLLIAVRAVGVGLVKALESGVVGGE